MIFNLPKDVRYIIDTLAAAGYRADIVGGSVRDLLRGDSPDDYDITTNATPDRIKAVFSHIRTVDTGIKHGTVSLLIGDGQYEVTTYRLDGEYRDSRHPTTVSFTSRLEDDLSRRDFTVNAIAYNPTHGITDPFGGRDDIKAGIIRTVGDPCQRFSEDALRILRGIRFSAVLGFEIEDATSQAIISQRNLLNNVSVERIYIELTKLISGEDAYSVLSNYSEVILTVIPEISSLRLPDRALFERSDFTSRLLSMFYLSSSDYDSACHRLHTDTHIRRLGNIVLSSVGKYNLSEERALLHLLRDRGVEAAEALLRLEILLGNTTEDSLIRLERIKNGDTPYSLSQLDISGEDILSLGAKGKAVGVILDTLLDAVIDNKIVNNKEKLLKMASELV